MRIGVDIKCLRYNNAGIGRYLRSILSELQKIDSKNEYFLFTPSPISLEIKNNNFKVIVCKNKIKQPGILWQQNVLPSFIRKNKIDVFWGPEQTIPYFRLKKVAKVLTIHDFVYKRFPKTMVKSVLFINKFFGRTSIKKADIICPVSEFTQNELIHFFPKIKKEKIHIVSNGVETQIQTNDKKIRGENLLFVGSLEPRKNLVNLLKALELLHNEGIDIPLTITGPSGWKNANIQKRIEKTSIAKNINQLGFVTDDILNKLYDTCAAIIFPSFYEGFGLPVLEALAHRTPILTTQGSAMEEIAGNFANYFDAKSPNSIAKTIINFYKNKNSFYENFEINDSKIKKILSQYSWSNTAKELLKQFENAFCSIQNKKEAK